MTQRLKELFRLMRPLNGALTFVSTGVGAWTAGGPRLLTPELAAGATGAALVSAGGYVINDFFDIEIDRINRPERPLPRGTVTPGGALTMAVTLFCVGTGLGFMASPVCGFIGLASSLLLTAYSRFLKGTVLWGNLTVGMVSGTVFIYGGLIAGNWLPALVPAGLAFGFHCAREIIKDLEDMRGDAVRDARTLPVVYGENPARITATVMLLGIAGGTLVPFMTGLYGRWYLYVVLFGMDTVLLYLVMLVWSGRHYGRISRVLKAEMLVGLAAVCLGRL